jgi:hypothetical protein
MLSAFALPLHVSLKKLPGVATNIGGFISHRMGMRNFIQELMRSTVFENPAGTNNFALLIQQIYNLL